MKLFVSDMDGTLLGRDHSISNINLAAIRDLERAGIVFAVATGRAYNDVANILEQSKVSAPVICSNGACVYSAKGELLHKMALSLAPLHRLCDFMDGQDIFYALNSPVAIHALPGWEKILCREAAQSSKERLEENLNIFRSQYGIIYQNDFDDFMTGQKDCCSLSVISLSHDKLHRLSAFVKTEGSVVLTVSGFDSLEILTKGSTKADALLWLAGYMDIPIAQTCAIGDNYNDLEMLQSAGVSFAMGNAPLDIKQASRYVTDTNNENGVAKAIHKILGEEDHDDIWVR